MRDTTIHVATALNKSKAVNEEDGQKIYDLILKAFLDKQRVILAFDNMEMLCEEFLQTAVGQLYENYSHAEIKKNMRIDNIPFTGKVALKRVVDKAKASY